MKIRKELNERVVQKWWEWGELDRGRWRQIHVLLNELLSDGKENWARTLLVEARALLADPNLDEGRGVSDSRRSRSASGARWRQGRWIRRSTRCS